LARSRLYSAETARPIRAPLLAFLLHEVPYVFPASEGPVARGLPTAWSAKPLSDELVVDQPVVWGGGAGDDVDGVVLVGGSALALLPVTDPRPTDDLDAVPFHFPGTSDGTRRAGAVQRWLMELGSDAG